MAKVLLEIEKLQVRVRAMESSKFWQLCHTWLQLKQTVGLGKDDRAELERKRTQIEVTQAELIRLENLIIAMESSKFWQLRKAWFRVKKSVGLGKNE